MSLPKEEVNPDIKIKDIVEAKKKSKPRAGLVKQSDIEGTRTEKEVMTDKTFSDKDNCECKCHPNKEECMECYQHPTHLKKNHTKTA